MSSLPSRWYIATPPALANDLDLFPILPGFSFLVSKRPQFSTDIAQSTSGRERRRQVWSYPIWNFKVSYEVLREIPNNSEIARLFAFFNAHAGRYQSFFFYDPTDNAVADEYFSTGDGTTTTFQLVRVIGAFNLAYREPISGILGLPTIKVNGSPVSGVTVTGPGQITLSSAPAAGAVLTWTGQFLFQCRFDQDDMDTQQMMQGLWSQSGLAFRTFKP